MPRPGHGDSGVSPRSAVSGWLEGYLRVQLGPQPRTPRGDAVAFVEANSKFRVVWLGAVPNMQLRELIERHDERVRWVRQMTLEDTKVRLRWLDHLPPRSGQHTLGDPVRLLPAMKQQAAQHIGAVFVLERAQSFRIIVSRVLRRLHFDGE
jgi:hypothetical protein